MTSKYTKTTASLPAYSYKLTNEIHRIYSIMHAKHSGRLTAMHTGRLTAVHSGRRNGCKI